MKIYYNAILQCWVEASISLGLHKTGMNGVSCRPKASVRNTVKWPMSLFVTTALSLFWLLAPASDSGLPRISLGSRALSYFTWDGCSGCPKSQTIRNRNLVSGNFIQLAGEGGRVFFFGIWMKQKIYRNFHLVGSTCEQHTQEVKMKVPSGLLCFTLCSKFAPKPASSLN